MTVTVHAPVDTRVNSRQRFWSFENRRANTRVAAMDMPYK